MYEPTILERVNQRRRQILVHSFLYYQLNTSKVDDHKYDSFVNDLIDLQAKYPEIAEQGIFADEFRGFQTGDSFKLPYSHPDVQQWAYKFLHSSEHIENKQKIQDKPKEV